MVYEVRNFTDDTKMSMHARKEVNNVQVN